MLTYQIIFGFVAPPNTRSLGYIPGRYPSRQSVLITTKKNAQVILNNLLTVVRTHVKAGENTFAVAAATLPLPHDITSSGCLVTYKARLNTHLFLFSFLAAQYYVLLF